MTVAALLACLFALAAFAGSSNAARPGGGGGGTATYKLLAFSLTPSTLQAGGHPSINYGIEVDATAATTTGDDLKSVTVEYPAGLLGNPEAATQKCSDAQFAADTCPAASQIGTMNMVLSPQGTKKLTATGSVHIMSTPTQGSVVTIGFQVRPKGYRRIMLKTEVTGFVGVRSGHEADYGLTLSVDNVPQDLTKTDGSIQPATVNSIAVNTVSSVNGKYFAFNPTRCDAANSKISATSYKAVPMSSLTSTFTPTGCASVPFEPSGGVTALETRGETPSGWEANFAVPTADAPIQNSHVRQVVVDLPRGTTMNFPVIDAVPARCTLEQLDLDACPADSKIGTASADVPFLVPEVAGQSSTTGDIYLVSRLTGVTFGYVLRGRNGVKAPLKGTAAPFDEDNDGSADFVRVTTTAMPQAPWTTAKMTFPLKMVTTPPCGSHPVKSSFWGYSGATKNLTNELTFTRPDGNPSCPGANPAPMVAINAPAAGSTFNTTTIPLDFTVTDLDGNGDPGTISNVTCKLLLAGTSTVSATNSNCTNSITATADGLFDLEISATDSQGATGSAKRANIRVDATAPNVVVTNPANDGAVFTQGSPVTIAFSVSDPNPSSGIASTTCQLAGPTPSAAAACSNSVTYNSLAEGSYSFSVTAADSAGNTAAAVRTFTVAKDNVAPSIAITAPSEGQNVPSTITATWTITDSAQSGVTASGVNAAATTCSLAGPTPSATAACPGGSKTFSGLANGSYTLTVNAADNAGNTSSATRNFNVAVVDNVPPTVTIQPPVISGNDVTITFSVSDTAQPGVPASGVKTVTCTLDGNPVTPCISPVNFQDLANGSHTFTVTATDNANNVGTGSVTFTIAYDNTPPTINITNPAAGATLSTNSLNATWTISDTAPTGVTPSGVNAASVTCALAGPTPTASGPCSTTGRSFTGLANGSYSLTVSASDNNGNANSASRSFTVAVDNVGPNISITNPANGSTYPSPTLNATWSISDVAQTGATPSGVNAASVLCSLTGPTPTAEAGCSTTGKTFSSLQQGSYVLTVKASDNNGNQSTATSSFTVAYSVAGPSINITTPATDGAVVSTTTLNAAWTISDPDGVNAASVLCSLAGPTPSAETGCSLTGKSFTGLANGSYTLTVKATDQHPTTPTQSTATRTFTVAYDNIGPSINITAPSPEGTQLANNVNTVNATWTISDTAPTGVTPAGVNTASVQCGLTGPTNVATTSCTATGKNFGTVANGSYTLTVSAADNAGNSSTATRGFIVGYDNLAPQVTINSPAAGASITNGTSVTATWTATDVAPAGVTPVGVASVTCSLAGPTPTASASCPGGTKTFSGLANGSYTLTVSATDNNGNGPTTVTRAFTVAYDAAAPTISITAPAAGATITNTDDVTATWTITDNASTGSTASGVNGAATTCSLAGPTPSAQTTCPGGSKTFSNLANGSYTLTVNAADSNGNTASATRAFSVAYDAAAPTISITNPTPDGATVSTSTVAATWTIADNATTGSTASGVNAASVTCALAGPTPTASAACSTTGKTFNGLTNGAYTLTVNAADNNGNAATATRTFNVAVDTLAPQVNITNPTAGEVETSATVAATWTITDVAPTGITPSGVNAASVTCSLAGPTNVASASCSTTGKTFGPLTNGAYTLTVNAADNNGNATTATRSFSVNAANAGPSINITNPAADGATVSTNSVAATWSISDPDGVNASSVLCSLAGPTPTAEGSCTTTGRTFSGLAVGSYTLTVKATDTHPTVPAQSTATRTFNVLYDNQAPSINITNPAAGATITSSNTVAATWTITDTAPTGVTPSGVNAASVTCSLAGPTTVASAACSTTGKTFGPLANGAYTLTVNASDNAGNGPTTATRSFTVAYDAAAPTVTINTPAAGATIAATSVTATWSITDNATTGSTASGVNDAATTCSLAGPTPTASAACPGGTKTFGSLANGSYTLSVTGADNNGNSATSTRSFTVAYDNAGPTITINTPTAGQVISTNSVNATWTIADIAPAGATAVGVNAAATTCSLAGPTPSAQASCPGGAKTFSGLANGSYTLTVNAADNNGNTSTATRAFSVAADNVAPSINITAPADGATITTSNTVAATWTITDTAPTGVTPSGVNAASVTCSLAGPTNVASASCSTTGKTFGPLANGAYTLTVNASDNAGNGPTTATRSFTVAYDSAAPTISITAPTAGQVVNATSVTATWTITDNASAGSTASGVNAGATTCSLAGPTPTASASCPGGTKTFSGLANGAYTLTVNAADNNGNTATATRDFTVAYDNLAPTITITAPTAGQVLATNSATATWTIADNTPTGVTASGVNAGATTCSLAGPTPTAQAACPGGTKTFSGLANGSYTLTVNAADNNGNATTATRAFSVAYDNVAPAINITNPATNGAVVNSSTLNATWTITDSAPTGVTASGVNTGSVTCGLAGPVAVPTASCTATGKSFTGLTDGSYTLTVSASDNNGNGPTTATRTFTVTIPDSVQPTITITNPAADGATVTSSSLAATWTITDAGAPGGTASGVNAASVTCSISGATTVASASCSTTGKTFSPLNNGAHTLTVNAADNAGNTRTATRAFTVLYDNVGPSINITNPATNGETISSGTLAATWTITDTAQTGATATGVNAASVTCGITGATTVATTSCSTTGKTFSGLNTGAHTLTVSAADNGGNSSTATRTFNVPSLVPPPVTTITQHAPASAKTTETATVIATATNSPTSFSYSKDGTTWSPCAISGSTGTCTIPMTGYTSPATQTYRVRASNGAGDGSPDVGHIWIDDRAVKATAAVTAMTNSSTVAMNNLSPYTAGAHPNVAATVTLEGSEDPKDVTVRMPDGLVGSLSAVPQAARCSVSQANSGSCPASAEIGNGSGNGVSVRDGLIEAAGKVYMVDSPGLPTEYAAGAAVEIEATAAGSKDLGRIVATGYLRVVDQGRAMQLEIKNLPRAANLCPDTNGDNVCETWASLNERSFHAIDVTGVLRGDVGYRTPASIVAAGKTNGKWNLKSRPLITNPHYCGAIWTSRTDMKNFVGSGTTYGPTGVVPEVRVPYVMNSFAVTGGSTCGSAGADNVFTPSISTISLADPATNTPMTTSGGAAGLVADGVLSATGEGEEVDYGTGTAQGTKPISTVTMLLAQMPPHVGTNTASFGGNSDQCSNTTFVRDPATGTTSPVHEYFDPTVDGDPVAAGHQVACAPQAKIGTAYITTPLVDQVLVGDIYYVVSSPIPNIGVYINPDVINPKTGTKTNPQGVTVGVAGRTSTPDFIGAEWYTDINTFERVYGNCVPDASTGQECNIAVQIQISSLADVPISALRLDLGDRPERVGLGAVTSQYPLVLASCGDPTHPDSNPEWTTGDPNTGANANGGVGPATITQMRPYSRRSSANVFTSPFTQIVKNVQKLSTC